MSYLKDVSKVPELSLDVPLKINVDVNVGAVCDNRNSNDKDGLDVWLNPEKMPLYDNLCYAKICQNKVIIPYFKPIPSHKCKCKPWGWLALNFY